MPASWEAPDSWEELAGPEDMPPPLATPTAERTSGTEPGSPEADTAARLDAALRWIRRTQTTALGTVGGKFQLSRWDFLGDCRFTVSDVDKWGQRSVVPAMDVRRGQARTRGKLADNSAGALGDLCHHAKKSPAELVRQVKVVMRTPGGKEQWSALCRQRGGGTLDPRLHKEHFLQDFLDNLCA